MKVESIQKEFNPITISITFESKEEAEVFYELFNYGPIGSFVSGKIDHDRIRKVLSRHGISSGISNIQKHLRTSNL